MKKQPQSSSRSLESSWNLSSLVCEPGVSHRVEDECAVFSFCGHEDAGHWQRRGLWHGTTSLCVERNYFLVKAQLAWDAVKWLWIQVQDGD